MHRNLIGILLILALFCIGWGPMMLSSKPSSGVTATLTFFWRFENDLNLDHPAGDDFSSGDAIAEASGATFSAVQKKHGGYSGMLDTTNDYFYFNDGTIPVDGTSGEVGFWIYADDYADGNITLFVFDEGTWENRCYIGMTSAGALLAYWTDGGNVRVNATGNGGDIPNDSWVYVNAEWDTVGNTFKVWVNNVSKISETPGTMNAIDAPTQMVIGDIAGGVFSGNPVYIDTIAISSDETDDLYLVREYDSYTDF